MIPALVYLPDGRAGPGRLAEAALDVIEVNPAELVLPEVTVRDERSGYLLDGAAMTFDPAAGGGPLADPAAERQARAFGVANTAFHAQRALRFAAAVLGRSLPRLVIRIGMHDQPRHWHGGHYRLPAPSSEGEEPPDVSADGEVHLGGGAGFITMPGADRYFNVPAHNCAIICHEVGHHICRHTADFRLNRLRPATSQSNGKTAIDEGTADAITAILLGTPDIYAWHRGFIAEWDQRRRKLHPRWTMAQFRGGHDQDPHADGTVWASACWSARERVAAAGVDAARFDAALLRGLESADDDAAALTEDALRKRRHFSRLLTAITRADPALAPLVLAAMAEHGIRPGASNATLRDAARAHLARADRAQADPARAVYP
ncbi:hypothetical protein NGB36_02870 [Streptomyces sp. RB6PN25]|uniref:Uncharacterized protein n=1 Tax=Streptomyces humicola TaxID=2953240 RepID=A0ABT1PRJ1_9ACTN|nr:hypothetical protein [Streptomyces humicola]MCQ4079570.1 hypothetical protein [Streptomyces humicola]